MKETFTYIVQIASECAPVAKVGGLGDVVFGLTRELEIRGNSVEIILPKYDCMRYDTIFGLTPAFTDLWVPWYGGAIHCTVFFGFVNGRKCFFIEPHSSENFFNRRTFYGCTDDIMRYAFFSKAALEFLLKSGKRPDIIHVHDWQTGLVPVLLAEIYKWQGMGNSRVCFTIHNFKHQGVTGGEILKATGLNRPDHFFRYEQMRDNEHPQALNLMKSGIVYSNFVTTVSPRHAWEARVDHQGHGLTPTLNIHQGKFGGILNGIDYDEWNPEVDRFIPKKYGINSLDDKYANKEALRSRFFLRQEYKPLISYVGRLDDQKGLHLVKHALFYALSHGAQFVLLGVGSNNAITQDFWNIKNRINDNPDSHIELSFNEELSHLIYAGSDMVLVPSMFEPCGLTQMIGLKYGAVPVVRSVGGLSDTVFDKDYSDRALSDRNGFTFNNTDNRAIESTLDRAIACWYGFPGDWRSVMQNGMRYDFSWNWPGSHYMNVYTMIREK